MVPTSTCRLALLAARQPVRIQGLAALPHTGQHRQLHSGAGSNGSSGSNAKDDEQCRRFLASFSKDSIPRETLLFQYSRSSGPGGQNVNKVNTKVDMRFAVRDADWLPAPVKARLIAQNPARINKKGEFVLSSDRFRTQPQNLEDCMGRLGELVSRAAYVADGPSAETVKRISELKDAEKERRRRDKQHRSSAKAERRGSRFDG
ncbi:hypothetical protein BC831DRAFT_454433 [Entophlyctis helioformis]|nr:hypothetical protein BC831DRAFT_454433 [Entophlyctis helioformis]